MDIDILAALASDGPSERLGRCALQRRIDSIPEETPGREDLLAAIESPAWSAPRVAKVMVSLGLGVNLTTIRMHRSHTCPCYLRG